MQENPLELTDKWIVSIFALWNFWTFKFSQFPILTIIVAVIILISVWNKIDYWLRKRLNYILYHILQENRLNLRRNPSFFNIYHLPSLVRWLCTIPIVYRRHWIWVWNVQPTSLRRRFLWGIHNEYDIWRLKESGGWWPFIAKALFTEPFWWNGLACYVLFWICNKKKNFFTLNCNTTKHCLLSEINGQKLWLSGIRSILVCAPWTSSVYWRIVEDRNL